MSGEAPWSMPDDGLSERLAGLADRIEATFGDVVEVYRDDELPSVSIDPKREGACWLSWIEFGRDEIVLQVSDGGRWELPRDLDNVEYLERIVDAVAAGRVVEVLAAARSSVTVTLDDGSTEQSAVSQGLRGCVPLPGWPRWGRKVHYLPYAQE